MATSSRDEALGASKKLEVSTLLTVHCDASRSPALRKQPFCFARSAGALGKSFGGQRGEGIPRYPDAAFFWFGKNRTWHRFVREALH